jgi:hypothetical protein
MKLVRSIHWGAGAIFLSALGCAGSADPGDRPQDEAVATGADALSICTFFPSLCPDAGHDAGSLAQGGSSDGGGAGVDAALVDASSNKADAAMTGSTAVRCFCDDNQYADLPCGSTDCSSGAALEGACAGFCGSSRVSTVVCVEDAGVCTTGSSPPNASKPEPNLVSCSCASGSLSLCHGALSGTNCSDGNRTAVLEPICAGVCASLGGVVAAPSCVIDDSTCVFAPQ